MATKPKVAKIETVNQRQKTSQQEAVADAAHELIFAVVGHVGSGTSEIASQPKSALEDMQINGESVDVEIVKAKTFMNDWAEERSIDKPRRFRY
ncbi:MAG: hypothetical protein U5K38_01770 [Woeseiaceae bacterium]|nr:hypothetical protein [Woeseiaceae bacterium]